MRKLILLIQILILSAPSFAQSKIIFEDDFKYNKYQWSESNTKDISTDVKDGVYIIEHKRKTGSWNFWKTFYLDYDKDFYIEAKITQVRGVDNYGYGLLWGGMDADNANFFIVSSNGMYRIHSWVDGEFTERVDWTNSNSVKELGKANILGVKQKNNSLYFYINGDLVKIYSKQKCYGANVGFVAYRDMKIEVDYLKIYQDDWHINLVSDDKSGYKKENLGSSINSPYSEIMPIISPDGKTLYVARKKHYFNKGVEHKDDIWYAKIQSNNKWGKLKNIGSPLNNEGHNSLFSVTPDGNTVFLMNLYETDGSSGGSGISKSSKTQSGWKLPQKIKIEDYYNDNDYVEYYMSVDQQYLLMTVERKEGYGQKDVYVSFKKGNKYSKPKNLGSTINTLEDEVSPFLAPDNVTLYYATSGKPGFGNADIFVSKRLDDTWTNWSEPKNMGPSINSSGWDAYYSLPASGEYAYLASDRFTFGRTDIFRIKLEEEAKPEPVVLIYGKVLNKKTKRPISANINYEFLKNSKEAGEAISNPKTGEYQIVLPYGEYYGYQAQAKNFLSISENIDLRKIEEYTEIEQNLYLVPIEVGEFIVLNNVFFKPARAEILPESYSELDRIVKTLKDNPKIEIELAGHTENRGNKQKLIELSEKRVEAVKKYLIKKGISKSRITGQGYGPDKPIASNSTPEGRRKNRRVEFKIKKK